MPTFTTVALDSLIEPKASKPVEGRKLIPEPKLERRNNSNSTISGTHGANRKPDSRNSTKTIERKHHWTQISPALYATPEPTPLPDSPLSFPPSPYIVDHKRRGPRLSKAFSEANAGLDKAIDEEKSLDIGKSAEAEDVTDTVSGGVQENRVKFVLNGDRGRGKGAESSKVFETMNSGSGEVEDKHNGDRHDGEVDDFFDPHDSMSIKSSNDGENNYEPDRALHHITPVAEFYDAWEELATETGIQHTANDVEAELSEMRMGFLIEMEKKKQAESRLNDMKSQWGRIREQLSVVGLTLPADPTMLDESANDPGEELCHQVNLVRFVSNAVGKGIARAELEEEFEAQLQSKNFEIARLLDRVHYYEAVNHEMSQRNQESVETQRCLRQRRKRRQKWIWSSIAVAITLGSTALAWSYLPTSKGSSSSTDPSPTRTSETNR